MRAIETDPEDVDAECIHCGKRNVVWANVPHYKEEPLSTYLIEKAVTSTEEFNTDHRGPVIFHVKLLRMKNLDGDYSCIWLPYWINIHEDWRYGQYSPIMAEEQFIDLIIDGIEKGIFKKKNLNRIKQVLS